MSYIMDNSTGFEINIIQASNISEYVLNTISEETQNNL